MLGYSAPVLSSTAPLAETMLWRGKRVDPTGFYWMHTRPYDPVGGRFLAPDPLGHGGSWELYSYADNDPVNRFDPDGRLGRGIYQGASDQIDVWLGNRNADGVRVESMQGSGAYRVGYEVGQELPGFVATVAATEIGGALLAPLRLGRLADGLAGAERAVVADVDAAAGVGRTAGLDSGALKTEANVASNANSEMRERVLANIAESSKPSAGSNFGTFVSAEKAAANAGPGQFMQVSESMSARSVAYQSRITGLPSGTGYVVDGVKFDGFSDGALLDAKGPGYAGFVRDGQFRSWWRGADSFLAQARRQLQAAGGTPIQWHFAEESAANATRGVFQSQGISGVEVLHTP